MVSNKMATVNTRAHHEPGDGEGSQAFPGRVGGSPSVSVSESMPIAQTTPRIAGREKADRADRRAEEIDDEQHAPCSFPTVHKVGAGRFAREARVTGEAEIQVELDRPNKGREEQPAIEQAAPNCEASPG